MGRRHITALLDGNESTEITHRRLATVHGTATVNRVQRINRHTRSALELNDSTGEWEFYSPGQEVIQHVPKRENMNNNMRGRAVWMNTLRISHN